MTVTTNQRYCSQIWVVTEVIIEIATKVLAEVTSGEYISVVDVC